MEAATAMPETRTNPNDPNAVPYTFEVLPIADLFVDADYQRPLTNFVDKIAEDYDPALIGCLVVSRRGEVNIRYAVVDGQTRMEGASRVGVTALPCVVFHNLKKAQEADLFARLQKERRGIASYHRFRADLVAGKREAKQIVRICREAGYEVGLDRSAGELGSVAALENCFRRGPEILERTMLILSEGWGDQHHPTGDVIKGLGYFLEKNEKIDDERLASRLKAVSPDALGRRASALREGSGGGGAIKYMAGAIEGIYRRKG